MIAHATTDSASAHDEAVMATVVRQRLLAFLRPYVTRLTIRLDIRLVRTFCDLIATLVAWRHRALGLVLTELGAAMAGGAHAPAGTKRIGRFLHAPAWTADVVTDVWWSQATAMLATLQAQEQDALVLWDDSVIEKPESRADPDLMPVRSNKARRLRRYRPGFGAPLPGRPITVPGWEWTCGVVVGMHGTPQLACMEWWSRRGPHATDQRTVQRRWLAKAAQDWGSAVWHVWDRGFAGAPWVHTALDAHVRFVVRWKKGINLRDARGEERKAWMCVRGKRSVAYRHWRDPHSGQVIKVGVVAQEVSLVDDPQPLWLVTARLGHGREPWYLLTNAPIQTHADLWRVVAVYARRWQIEWVFRFTKSEVGFESLRVREPVRVKLLVLASLVYAFLITLLAVPPLAQDLLRVGCHRTGTRARAVKAPLYRLRAAVSRVWGGAAIAPPHAPLAPPHQLVGVIT